MSLFNNVYLDCWHWRTQVKVLALSPHTHACGNTVYPFSHAINANIKSSTYIYQSLNNKEKNVYLVCSRLRISNDGASQNVTA